MLVVMYIGEDGVVFARCGGDCRSSAKSIMRAECTALSVHGEGQGQGSSLDHHHAILFLRFGDLPQLFCVEVVD